MRSAIRDNFFDSLSFKITNDNQEKMNSQARCLCHGDVPGRRAAEQIASRALRERSTETGNNHDFAINREIWAYSRLSYLGRSPIRMYL